MKEEVLALLNGEPSLKISEETLEVFESLPDNIIRIKCDTCACKVLSDETSVGLGFIPICNAGHWGGECEEFDKGYCPFRDNCIDYKMKQTL